MLSLFKTFTREILSPNASGIDISDRTVKFGRIEKRGSALKLDYYGELGLPEGIVVGGEIKNPEELARALRRELKTADGRKVQPRYVVASLPEEKSFVRVLRLSSIKEEDLGRVIQWEVEGAVPLPLQDIYFDYGVIENDGVSRHRDVVIEAFPRETVDQYHEVLQKAGYMPLALELESQSISRALVGEKDITPAMLIDIGAQRTSFITMANGAVIFTRGIATGGQDFDQAIASGLHVSVEEAQRLKMEVGLDRDYQDGALIKVLMPHLTMLRNELSAQVGYYRTHPLREHIELGDIRRVILCGGDANLMGLPKYLSTAVKLPVELGNPFSRFQLAGGEVPLISKSNSLKYATVLGLALRGVGR